MTVIAFEVVIGSSKQTDRERERDKTERERERHTSILKRKRQTKQTNKKEIVQKSPSSSQIKARFFHTHQSEQQEQQKCNSFLADSGTRSWANNAPERLVL